MTICFQIPDQVKLWLLYTHSAHRPQEATEHFTFKSLKNGGERLGKEKREQETSVYASST